MKTDEQKMLEAFKKAVVVGECLHRSTDKQGNVYEVYPAKNCIIIIEISALSGGFEVYKQLQPNDLEGLIEFIHDYQ